MRIKPGDPVIRFDNRLSLGGRAVVYDRIVIPALMFKGLTERRLRDRQSTIYSLYQTEFGITVLRAQERSRAAAADRDTARVLGVAARTAGAGGAPRRADLWRQAGRVPRLDREHPAARLRQHVVQAPVML
ncbi:MAG: UTRA domain-containing protein [Candidatus Nanopelagicales bacterium]